ncbi:MAG: sulfatase-like hydrolase/transferase [Desulfobulbaceae bacterium]|nr:sulfatase-like hydrolase/transferase [Desulfobulbaceae bacterium]
MRAKLIITTVILLACLAGAVLLLKKTSPPKVANTLADLAPELGLSVPGGEAFRLTKNLSRRGEGQAARSIEAEAAGKLMKIEVISNLSPEEATRTREERLTMLNSLFSNVPAPYPGMITNQVTMPDALRPRRLEVSVAGAPQSLYILPASSRHTYGVTEATQAAFQAGVLFLYDQTNRTFYRCDLFIPKAGFSESALTGFVSGLRLAGQPAVAPVPTSTPVAATSATSVAKAGDPSPIPASTPSSAPTATPAAKQNYNLILIAFEPLGANHVGAYGYAKNTTPNFDAFAKESFLFEQAVSPSSWTLPAFMSWFTSLYPERHQVTNKYSKYSEQEAVLASLSKQAPGAVTLTQVLREQGYRTGAFTGGASLAKEFGFGLGFEEYQDEPRFGGFDRTMPAALEWLGKHRQEKFFLFVEGYDVHGQFPLKRENLGRFLNPPYQGKLKGTEEEYWALRDRNLEEGGVTIPPEDLRFWKAIYDTKIYDADQRFGVFIAKLRELGLLENSIVIVSSGSGNEYLEHGRIDHGFSLYEELTHVPLLIRVPGKQGRIPDLVRTLDLMPTALELLGVKTNAGVKKQMQGVSLTPLLHGQHLVLDGISETDYLLRAFRRSLRSNDGWKFIISLDTEERELYNLKSDPGEQRNLARENPRKAYELEQRLFGVIQAKK